MCVFSDIEIRSIMIDLLYKYIQNQLGPRCSSVVRAFTHGAMDCWINPSWWTYCAISRSSQCSTTGVTKVVVCSIMSVGRCI